MTVSAHRSLRTLRTELTRPATWLALAALVVALGGTAYAATLARNSVTTTQVKNSSLLGVDLKNGTVGTVDLATGSVTSVKVKNESLLGADIKNFTLTGNDLKDGSLGTAPLTGDSITSAKLAPGAVTTADIAGNAVTSAQIEPTARVGTRIPYKEVAVGTSFDVLANLGSPYKYNMVCTGTVGSPVLNRTLSRIDGSPFTYTGNYTHNGGTTSQTFTNTTGPSSVFGTIEDEYARDEYVFSTNGTQQWSVDITTMPLNARGCVVSGWYRQLS